MDVVVHFGQRFPQLHRQRLIPVLKRPPGLSPGIG
jgi:hypothetical protein